MDAAANLAEDTTSKYCRDRGTLDEAALDRLEQVDVPLPQDQEPAGQPQNVERPAGQLAALILALAHSTLGSPAPERPSQWTSPSR